MIFGYIMFAIMILLQPVAQILEKHGIDMVGVISGVGGDNGLISKFWTIVTNPYILGGVTLSAIGLFCWLVALSHFKVSYLYPFGAVSYIVLALLSMAFLGETISLIKWAGIIVIVIGAVLLNQ